MKKFFTGGAALALVVLGFGISNQFINDHTMKNCTVQFASNPFNTPSKSTVNTSCGYVYLDFHMKNGGPTNPDALVKMNEAVHSGKPVDIKATGLIPAAYEITVSK